MRAEQICILHSLEVLSFGCNPASRVNSKTPVRLSKGVRSSSVPQQGAIECEGFQKCSSFVLTSSYSSARIEIMDS